MIILVLLDSCQPRFFRQWRESADTKIWHGILIIQPHYRVKQLAYYEHYNFHYTACIEIKRNMEI